MNPYEEYRKKVQKNMNASMFARDSYSKSLLSNEKLREVNPWRPYQSEYGFNPDLDTSEGLYELSKRVGLEDEANRAVTKAGGESMRYMSGGFIMDAMDMLNTLQYGVAGVVKGKGFVEGVKNRESFSDDDALGQYGWGGKIAGLALDIATDPLTYVAPWKQLSKIPGFAKTVEAGKSKAFGELNVINIKGQEMQWRSGGWTPLNFLADRLVYGHAVDRNFRRAFEKLQADKENAFASADDLISLFSKIDPTVSKATLSFTSDGSMISKNLSELQGSLSKEDFAKVEVMYKMRDKLMKDLVDEGVISEAAAKTHWNTYLKQSYDEFVLSKKGEFKKKGIVIDNTSRIATKETREGLTFVEDAPAVWAGTLKKQIENLYNARINKMVAKNFALDDVGRLDFAAKGGDVNQLVQVPQSPNYMIKGDEIDYKMALKSVQKGLKTIRKQRAKALGDESSLVTEIKTLEKQLENIKAGGEEKLGEALSGFKRTLKEAGLYEGPRKKVPVGQGQKAVADALKKWMNRGTKSDRLARETLSTQKLLDELFEVKDGVKYAKTKEGIVLQKAFDNPQMMFQWDSPLDFLDAVRYPDKAKIAQEAIGSLTPDQILAKNYDNVEDFLTETINKEFGVSVPLDELFQSISNTGNKLSGGKLDFDSKELLSELGIKRGKEAGDVTDVLSFDKLKKTTSANEVEENLRTVYNYFARKNNLPFAKSVSLGKNAENPFKNMIIKVEDGLPDTEILNISNAILKDLTNRGRLIASKAKDEIPLIRKREEELERIWKNRDKLSPQLTPVSDTASDAAIKLAEKKARKAGQLAQTKEVLEDVNLKLVRESVDRIEQDLADALFKRQNILEALNENARGQLAGKWMHKDTWSLLKETTSPDRQIGEPIVQHFKKAKVIWNISSYPRNAMSAMVQNWWRLGIGPWKLGSYMDAVSELKNGGKYLDEMKDNGFSMRSGALGEILNNYVNDMTLGNSVGGAFAKTKDKLKHVDKVMSNTYGHIDNVAKIAAYRYGREVRGWDPEKALKAAYEATYNYSQVTPFVHQMRRAIWGVPFITFNLKSVGLVASTLKHAPGRISVFGKARNDLFKAAGVEGEQEAESMPDYMRDDTFMLRLPWKDGEGRSMYFDLSYILPIGSIMSGEYLKNPIGANPVLQLVKELSQNKTFAGHRIFNESDDIDGVVSDIFIHTSKLALPPIFEQQLSKGYDNKGNRVPGVMFNLIGTDTQDRGANERTFYQEMFRLAGMNVTPYDLESRQQSFDWRRKDHLQTMLAENGVLSEFTRPYLPEDSPAQPQPFSDRTPRPIGR